MVAGALETAIFQLQFQARVCHFSQILRPRPTRFGIRTVCDFQGVSASKGGYVEYEYGRGEDANGRSDGSRPVER
jgi:hypothetical protein